MPLVLDAFPLQQLENLCFDLEGSLAVIFTEKYNDKDFVLERIKKVTAEYEHILNSIPYGLSTAMDVILYAFNDFEILVDDTDNPEDLKQKAFEIFTLINADPEEYLERDIERLNENF